MFAQSLEVHVVSFTPELEVLGFFVNVSVGLLSTPAAPAPLRKITLDPSFTKVWISSMTSSCVFPFEKIRGSCSFPSE